MKNLLLLIFSLAFYAYGANAQKISIKKDIAYADDSAYCKVSGKTGFAGSMETSFSIAGMDDTEYDLNIEVKSSYTLKLYKLTDL